MSTTHRLTHTPTSTQTPATAAFAAQAAGANYAPFYKRLVLIDDFYFAEGLGP